MKSEISYPISGKSVIKRCRTAEECANELQVYRLELENTPRLLRIIDERTIEISRIFGNTYSGEKDLNFSEAGKLFSQLHSASKKGDMVICQLDTNPRNYLIEKDTGRYFMIDFSESAYQLPENDLFNFLLFWAAILRVEEFRSKNEDFLRGYGSWELLDEKRKETHFPIWIAEFDERRRKFCKNPGTELDWQKMNREYLIEHFYDILR
jgi:hypothetical protein